VRAAAGEVVPPRAEADLDEALRAASCGAEVGSAMRHSGLQLWQPRYDTALVGAEAYDDTVEIRTRLARPRRSTGVSVEALVRREGAASTPSRRGAHRHRRSLPRRTLLLVTAVGAAVAAAGASTVSLISDHGASARTVPGQDHAEAPRLDVPSAGPSASADLPDLHLVSPEVLAALSRLADAASGQSRPSPVPKPTEQTLPIPSPRSTPDAEPVDAEPVDAEPVGAEPTEDSEPTDKTDGTSSRRSKGAESRGSGDRDRGSDARSGGAGRRG
jgi:hypothetical protein